MSVQESKWAVPDPFPQLEKRRERLDAPPALAPFLTVIADVHVRIELRRARWRAWQPKQPSDVVATVGGNALSVVAAGIVNQVGAVVVIAAQARGPWAAYCRDWLDSMGVCPALVERGEAPSLVVVVRDKWPFRAEVFDQPAPAIRLDELSPPTVCALRTTKCLIAGPAAADIDTCALLTGLPAIASGAYRALVASPALAAHPDFVQIASGYDYVQITEWGGRALLARRADVVKYALRLRHLLGGWHDVAVLGVREDGWLWTGMDQHWHRIAAISKLSKRLDEDVFAATFCGSFVVARNSFVLPIPAAIQYAIETTEAAAKHPDRTVTIRYRTRI